MFIFQKMNDDKPCTTWARTDLQGWCLHHSQEAKYSRQWQALFSRWLGRHIQRQFQKRRHSRHSDSAFQIWDGREFGLLASTNLLKVTKCQSRITSAWKSFAIAVAFDFMLFGAQQIALRIGTWWGFMIFWEMWGQFNWKNQDEIR